MTKNATHAAHVVTFYMTVDSELDDVVRWVADGTPRAYTHMTGIASNIDVGGFVTMNEFEDGVLKPSELLDSGHCTLEEIEAMPFDERAVKAYLLRQGYDGIVTVKDIFKPATAPDNIVAAYPFPKYWRGALRNTIADLLDADAVESDKHRAEVWAEEKAK